MRDQMARKHQYKGLNFSAVKKLFRRHYFHNFSTKQKNTRQSSLPRVFLFQNFFSGPSYRLTMASISTLAPIGNLATS